ncbi:MAG TPA: membrane protein insertase YidC [Terriglobales bacterium]|nr:membrane protein insertase YidC [Terriglobales bacterium]
MERRALIAVAISLFILIIYQAVLLPLFYPGINQIAEPIPESMPAGEPARAGGEPPPADAVPAPPPEVAAAPARQVVVETDQFIATLSSRGGRLESFALKKDRTTVDPDSPPQDLIVAGPNGEKPVAVELRALEDSGDGQRRLAAVSDVNAAYAVRASSDRLTVAGEQSVDVELEWASPAGTIRKIYTFRGDRADFSLAVRGENLDPRYREIGVSYLTGTMAGREKLFDRVAYLRERKLVEHYVDASELTEGEIVSGDPGWTWSGVGGTYFLAAMIPIEAGKPRLFLKQRDKLLEQKILFPISGTSFDQQVSVYIGSKRVETLQTVGHNLNLAVDMGWFSMIAELLLWLLRQSHKLTGNYGVDIILLTVLTKIAFLPLTRKSFESMRAMQKLQPQMTAIRERLKDKPDEMNKEVMELYRRHGVNPLGGCLPMLVQIPVFIGLYQALLNAVELRHAPFMLWIDDLSAPDRLGTLAIPFIDPPGIPVLTVVMGATMFAQQWMTPSTGDPTQRQMMMIMPLLFTFMFVSFPAGLVLYWTVNNILTVAQQYYISHRAEKAAA